MRLTKRDGGENACMDCENCEIKYRESCCSLYLCRNALIKKLAAYEDTGLSPEEIKLNMDGLDEYRKAEAEGRLVILPCKVGDTVYEVVKKRVDLTGYRMEWGWETAVEAVKFRIGMIDSVGKTVFLTREEAEAVLKGETEQDDRSRI